jgi:UDP-2-acetamido-3-amino-2,3-dideoxy-glucuronate N-acetyltransferase
MIGAGSMVTKNIPAGEVWVGNPAHFVKKVGDV